MKAKGTIRALVRRGSKSNKKPAVAVKTAPAREPAVCERCGAVYAKQTWRRDRKVSDALAKQAEWTVCPACSQASRGQAYGRVIVRGPYAAANEAALRQRIKNIDARAQFTQPERRVVSVDRDGDVMEILTTSQKLAHRIVRELKKAFKGEASYAWSDRDGSLHATWERHDVPPPKPAKTPRRG